MLFTEPYCQHLVKAKEAQATQERAKEISINMTKFSHLRLEAAHLQLLSDACYEDEIKVFSLPGNNVAVPALYSVTHENPLSYIHIRNNKCPLQICREKKSKLHSLMKKENPLCLHTLLSTMCEKDIAPATMQPPLTNKTSKTHREKSIEVNSGDHLDSLT